MDSNRSKAENLSERRIQWGQNSFEVAIEYYHFFISRFLSCSAAPTTNWNYKSWIFTKSLTNEIAFDKKIYDKWTRIVKLVPIGQKFCENRIYTFQIGCWILWDNIFDKSNTNIFEILFFVNLRLQKSFGPIVHYFQKPVDAYICSLHYKCVCELRWKST